MPDLLASLGGVQVPTPIPQPPSAAPVPAAEGLQETAAQPPAEVQETVVLELSQKAVKSQEKKAHGAKGALSLEEAIKSFREFLKNYPADLQFSEDERSGSTVIKVVNPMTKEVLRQIPCEEVLAIARRIREVQASSAPDLEQLGILLDKQL